MAKTQFSGPVDSLAGFTVNGSPIASSFTQQATPGPVTDNSGGAAADGTIAVVTAPTALTDNGGGTADGTVQAMPDPADTPATADALRDDLVANFCLAVRNNMKEFTTSQAADRVAIVALTDAVKELSTKVNAVVAVLLAAGVTV